MTPLGFDFDRRTVLASRHPWNWIFRGLSLDALSGQAGTLTRTTTATGTDSYGASYTAVHSQPTAHYVAGRALAGLLLGTNDTLAWTVNVLPQASCGMVRFIENGSLASAGAGVFYLGLDAGTGARLYIDSSGTQYRITHHNGTSSVTSTLSGTAPVAGDLVELRWRLKADGTVQLWQSINGGAETAASASGTLTLAAAWGGTTLRLNSVGTASKGNNVFLGGVLTFGDQTTSLLQAASS